MLNFFTLDGKSSEDFGCYIATSNCWDGAERDAESVEIPGRSGTLEIDHNRYKNFTATAKIFIRKDMQSNVPGLRGWLLSKSGYRRYEEMTRPDEYRQARYVGPFTLTGSDRIGAYADITFDMMPQRWLKSGELKHEFRGSGTIYNPTLFDAKPMIRVYGKGSITIGGKKITINSAGSYTDIDCDAQECFRGSVNCNENVTLNNGEFPVIPPGESSIVLNGVTADITPRWWTI